MVYGWVGGHGGVFEEMGTVVEGVWRLDREYESVEGVERGGSLGR